MSEHMLYSHWCWLLRMIREVSGMVPKVPALLEGDNLQILKGFPDEFVDLVYMDPPFFTGKQQRLFDRSLHPSPGARLSFCDVWVSNGEYLEWVRIRLAELRRVLKQTGSLFLHCDWHASHLLRVVLDEVFGAEQFRSEVIWYYKRWTNGLRSLQRAHQTIYFYSRSDQYKFNVIYEDYSLATNIDQIWQKRTRDADGKCVTANAADGSYIPLRRHKAGVPMRDVWEIPYINPRAKERTGWPTQKPVELLRRVILLATDEGDLVLDPVCGSGTALVAAKALGRQWIGIDSSPEAIHIADRRLLSSSDAFSESSHHRPYRLSRFLGLSRHDKIRHIAELLDVNIAHRNGNLDGFLRRPLQGAHAAFRLVDEDDPARAIARFAQAAQEKHCTVGVVVIPVVTEAERQHLQDRSRGSIRVVILSYDDLCRGGSDIERALNARQVSLDLR